MKIGTKSVNGYTWPATDIDCASVIFERVNDLIPALAYVKQRKLAIQAGGNTGVWPKFLAREFEQVYTFEPEPNNYHCLAVNCVEPNITIFAAALGAHWRTTVHMEYPEGPRNMGACRVAAHGNIPIVTIDSLRLDYCDFIQLDIEGYEPHAIEGAADTIRKYRPVLMLEDKGLSENYGFPQDWTRTIEDYKIVYKIERDVILVPRELLNA